MNQDKQEGALVPAIADLFTWTGDGVHLMGAKCELCGTFFFPMSHEQHRPGVMERYELGYPQIQEINPHIIYCSITGYGQIGPYAQLPSHDPNIQAFGGIMKLTRGKNGPGIPGIPIGDILAGSNAAIAILMALIAREKGNTGGQYLDWTYPCLMPSCGPRG